MQDVERSIPPDFLLKQELSQLRHEYSDEIPDRIVHGPCEGKDTKARRNWFLAVAGNLELLAIHGLVPEEIEPLIEQFVSYYTSRDFARLTEPQDIERANSIIDIVLGEPSQATSSCNPLNRRLSQTSLQSAR